MHTAVQLYNVTHPDSILYNVTHPDSILYNVTHPDSILYNVTHSVSQALAYDISHTTDDINHTKWTY